MENLSETKNFANFDPDWYVDNYFATEAGFNNIKPDLEVIHRIFNEHNINGHRLLDVGTGPTIHTVITSSNHVDEIFLSDYAPRNLQYLKRWHDGKTSYPNRIVDYVTSLEGRRIPSEQREEEVRQKVKGMLPIDVTSEQPLGRNYDGGKFETIITSCCFEAVASDVDGYKKCLENVSSLLNKGGYMIIAVCLEGERYQVGEYVYPSLSINKEQVDVAMAEAGYDVITSIVIPEGEVNINAKHIDTHAYYYVVGRKLT